MRNKMLHTLFGMLLLAGALSQAQAALVYTFSDLSSDTTPASDLDATLTFEVTTLGASGGATDLLTLTLDNQTIAPNDFAINELFFNFNGNHSGFNIESDPFTTAVTHGNGTTSTAANGFGSFDIKLDGFSLVSGGTSVWTIDLGLTGVTDADFNDWSSIPPGDEQTLAALKFVNGPGDDSAFAAVVPVPAAVWLFGSGLLGLVGIARRKRR